MNFLGYKLSEHLPLLNVTGKIVINTINPHSYCVCKNDFEFKNALLESDFLFPDGIGIVWATKFLKAKKIRKIAGFDVFIHLIKQLNQDNGRCFFLGASEATLEKIKIRLNQEFPNVIIDSFSPPFKNEFSIEENFEMIQKVNSFSPDVLFVGMTAPKQEKWVHANKDKIDARIICSIGAVFDFYAGTVKRPSQFWINLKLEWLIRFLGEPRRLFRRNFISTPLFLLDVFKAKIGMKIN